MEKTKLVERPLGAYQVQVPAGLTPGQQFLAEVPRHGQMRVTVPAGAAGGQFVEIEVPAEEASEVLAEPASEPASEPDLAPITHVVKDESKVPQLGETLTPIESGFLKEAEHSIASNISTVLGELRAKLHVMSLSYKDQENLAAKHKDTFAAKEDAEYQNAIKDLLGKVADDQNVYDGTKVRVVKDITKSLPSFVGIGHQVKDFSGVTKRVPMTGGWKTDVEKGLDAWRKTKTEHTKVLPDVPRSDEEWKNMKDDVKKNLGDAITKAADDYVNGKEITEDRSEEVRKGLGDANENVKSRRITPDSLTDAILTDCGAIKGAKIGSVRVFKGIPYAKAATGALRWMPPVPRHAKNENGKLDGCWVGTLMATDFGSVCPQAWDAVLSKDEKQSEDCLSLNIYAPTVESEEAVAGVRDKLPVVVFVHGGDNVAGAGSRYDMWDVADRGFVAVTINYRLGALGFLALSSLSQESASGTSGNYGIRDIALSLEWVQRNIAKFGGDPQHVTLMGHGSGATNVLGLSISPMAMLRPEGADEMELLRTMRRLLGVLDDQPLDDVSKQAGGYMASMAHAATVKQLKANIAELKISAAKRGVISLKQLDVLQSKLSSFAETDAVKKLVNGMLKEHEMRSEVKSSAGSSTKLFHGMVLLSAAPRIDRTRQDAESDNEQIAISAHCKQGTPDLALLADEAKCLRNLDVQSLLDATPLIKWDPFENPNANQYDLPVKGYRHLGLLVVDGQVIPEPLLTAFENKRFIDVPVMATIMGEEPDSQPPQELLSWKQLRDVVSKRLYSFGTFWDGKPDSAPDSWSEEALKLYSSDIYSNPQEAYESMITDVRLTCATKEAMRIVASASTQPVYMGINRLRLREPVAVVALASNGIRSPSTRGLAGPLAIRCPPPLHCAITLCVHVHTHKRTHSHAHAHAHAHTPHI
jgi:carboxylesterase type B